MDAVHPAPRDVRDEDGGGLQDLAEDLDGLLGLTLGRDREDVERGVPGTRVAAEGHVPLLHDVHRSDPWPVPSVGGVKRLALHRRDRPPHDGGDLVGPVELGCVAPPQLHEKLPSFHGVNRTP